VETFESNVVANKKLAKGLTSIQLVFTATDGAVLPTGAPTEVTFVRDAALGGSVALVSNVPIGDGKQRRYSYTYTVGATPEDGKTIGYSIKVADSIGNDGSNSSSSSELITIGMCSTKTAVHATRIEL